MRTIMITGALGQLGSELVTFMRSIYGNDRVIATDIRFAAGRAADEGPYARLDVMDGKSMYELAQSHGVDTIVHLAATLSAAAEASPQHAWKLNIGGLLNALEVSRELGCAFFTPSSIGVFGTGSPKLDTPQDTILHPSTIYGISKVSGELLSEYYYYKFGVDTRGLRFPGLISYEAPPGGGTTDYAVDIYVHAAAGVPYTCYLAEGTYLDMMYMPDALRAIVELLEADAGKLKHRSAFNVSAMSVEPAMIAAEIRKHIPDFKVDYRIDPVRQAIADSWPDRMDVTAAAEEWGFQPRFNLAAMTADMLAQLRRKGASVQTPKSTKVS